MKRAFRLLFFAVAGILLLSLGLLAVSQTSFFRAWLLRTALATVNRNMNGSLSVRSLQGNLISRVEVADLVLQVAGDSLVQIDRVALEYNPIFLLAKKVKIAVIEVEKPRFRLRRDADLRWNFSKLMPESAPADARPDNAVASAWDLDLPAIVLLNGTVAFDSSTAAALRVPAQVENFDLDLGFWYRKQEARLSLQNLSFRAEDPDLEVKSTQADVSSSEDSLRVGEFSLTTNESQLSAAAEVAFGKASSMDVIFSGSPVSLFEVRKFFPVMDVYGDARLELAFTGPLSDLRTNFTLQIGKTRVHMAGKLAVEQEPYRYDLAGEIAHLDLAELSQNDTLASDIGLRFELVGSGLAMASLNSRLRVACDSSVVMGRQIGTSVLTAHAVSDSITISADVNVADASAQFDAGILMSDEHTAYHVSGLLGNLDVARFGLQQVSSTDLNLTLDLQGSGMTMQQMDAVLRADFLPSQVAAIPVDTAGIVLEMKDELLQVQRFDVRSPLAEITASGHTSLQHTTSLQVDIDLLDASVLSGVLGVDSPHGSGSLHTVLTGALDSVAIQAELALLEVGAAGLTVSRLHGRAQGLLADQAVSLDFDGDMAGFSGSETFVDTANFAAQLADSLLHFSFDLERAGEYTAQTRGKLSFGDGVQAVSIADLSATFWGQRWALENDVSLLIEKNRYVLSQLKFRNAQQVINLSGTLDTEKSSDFVAAAHNIDISRFPVVATRDIQMQGLVDLETHFRGTFAKPILQASLLLSSGKYWDVEFDKFSGQFDFSDSLFSWRCAIAKTESDSLMQTSGKLPVRFALSPYHLEVLRDVPLELKASTRGLDISFMQAFAAGVENIRGILVADIVLRNTLDDLSGVGPIRLINGGMDIPELGTSFKKGNFVLVLNGRDVILKEVGLRSGGGYIKLIEGGLSLARDRIEDFSAKLKVKHFELVNNQKMKARAEGTVSISGSVQEPRFSGDLLIDQARIYYEKFEEETAEILSSRPFFVIGPDSTTVDTLGAMRFQKQQGVKEVLLTETAFYKNLRGRLSLLMPRNVWVRSADASIEVECDLSAVKETPELLLFGHCSTIRGFYELFGNRFQIRSGDLDFDGEPDMNPSISIEATTVVSDKPVGEAKPEKHEFEVRITGTLFFPEFQFLLDGEQAEQEDIVSILVFGQTFDQLQPGQKKQIGEEKGLDDRARGLVAGRLLKQLSNTLGSELSLDVIEIESGGSLTDSKVRVGKYVTPEVFVSVSQDFGAEGNQIVELEYEIPRKILLFNLLLQATSDRKGDTGTDVIWKIEW